MVVAGELVSGSPRWVTPMWQLDRASHYIAGIVRWIRSHSKAACYLISHRLLASYVQTVTEEISDCMRKSLGPVGLFNPRYSF